MTFFRLTKTNEKKRKKVQKEISGIFDKIHLRKSFLCVYCPLDEKAQNFLSLKNNGRKEKTTRKMVFPLIEISCINKNYVKLQHPEKILCKIITRI